MAKHQVPIYRSASLMMTMWSPQDNFWVADNSNVGLVVEISLQS